MRGACHRCGAEVAESAVGVRDNGPTDVEWFRSLQPGWQVERIVDQNDEAARAAASGMPFSAAADAVRSAALGLLN